MPEDMEQTIKIFTRMQNLLSSYADLKEPDPDPLRQSQRRQRLERFITEFDNLWPFWKQQARDHGLSPHVVRELEESLQELKQLANYRPPPAN